MAGDVKLRVDLDARDKMSRVLQTTRRSMASLAQEMIKAGAAQTKLGARVAMAIGTQTKFARSMVRTADAASKAGRALFSVKGAVGALGVGAASKAFAGFATAGEHAANVSQRFAQVVPNAAEALANAQRATAGLVEATDLQIVFNRFIRLGVSVKDTTRLLELATKASIDQGRSVLDVARVIESSLKGRTTGLIDIGVNIDKITGLTSAYAAETGVAVGELDEMDRRLKVALPAALDALGEQFDSVDVESFALRMQQTSTVFGDALSDMQESAAETFVNIAESMGIGKSVKAVESDVESLFIALENLDRRAQEARGIALMPKSWEASFAAFFSSADLAVNHFNTTLLDLPGAIESVRAKLDTLPPALRIEMWEQFAPLLENSSDKVRDLAKELFTLEDAANDAATAAFRLGFAQMMSDVKAAQAQTKSVLAQFAKGQAMLVKVANRGRRRGSGGRAAGVSPEIDRQRALQQMDVLALELKAEKATTDVQRIRAKLAVEELKVRQKWRETSDATLADARQTLELEKLRIQANKDIAEIAQSTAEKLTENTRNHADAIRELREEQVATIAGGIDAAMSSAAGLLGELDAHLARMEQPERYQRVIAGFNAIAANVGAAADSINAMGRAAAGSAEEVAHGVQAGLQVAGPAVASFVSGVKERAGIMAAFEAAMAVATAFTSPAESIGHGIAAAMMLAVAGMASGKPAAPAPASAGGTGSATGAGAWGPASEPSSPSTIVVNVGGQGGLLFGRPQEIGRAIADQMRSMDGTGMSAGAY